MSDPSNPYGQQPPQSGHQAEQPTQPYATQPGWGQPAQGWGQQPPQGWGQYPPQGWPGAYPQLQYRTTNGLAIASLVLGIMWIYWLGSILALVLGYVARKQIRERNQAGGGMATAGIVLGWIGVGTLLLMIGLFAVTGVVESSAGY